MKNDLKVWMKRAAGISLAAVTAVSLTACTSGADTDKTNAGAAGDSSEAAAGTYMIGGIGPLTGANAIYGQAVMNGAQLAVDEINGDGGMGGVRISFNFQDDEGDQEKAVNAYNTLKDWGMQMLMGTVTSTPCIAVGDKTHKDNMFQLTPSGTAVDCAKYDNQFRICFSDLNQGAASARYIGENKLASKVAVIYDSSDVYSSGIHDKFTAEAAAQGFLVVADQAFTSDNNTNFSVQLQKAKDSGAQLVFLPIYYEQAALILAQAKQMDYTPDYFGCDGMDGILTLEKFDTSLAEGVMLLTPFAADAQDDLTKKFVASYKEKFGEIPNQFAADAYDSIYSIKAAGEKAGITPDMNASAICDKLKMAMTEISVNGLTGENMKWTPDGEPNKAPKAVKIINGAYSAM